MRLRPIKDDSGTALVEFALLAPLLLVILFGVLEFGRAFNYWQDTTHLANEAARYAAVNNNPGGTTTAEFADWLREQMTTEELKNGTGSVEGKPEVCIRYLHNGAETDDPFPEDAVEVTVAATFDWMPLLDAYTSVGESSILGRSVMKLETLPANPADWKYTPGCA